MNYYQYHITDFNNATRHLTRTERSIYRDLLDIYYDTEKPLQADFERLARRVIATSEDERAALEFVLGEFFQLDGDVYRQERCDREIEEFHVKVNKKIEAGRASARARSKAASKQKLTPVEQVLDERLTDVQLPSTHNTVPSTEPKEIGQNRKRFVPPSLQELAEHIREKGYGISADQFWNFYESKGWLIGKSKMKSWQAAAAQWESRRQSDASNQRGTGGGHAAPKLTAAQRIAAKRSELAAQSPDMGTVAADDRDVRTPLDESAGRRSERHLVAWTR
jgi:uncharacterized protein YdaU (DUF1376 family)